MLAAAAAAAAGPACQSLASAGRFAGYWSSSTMWTNVSVTGPRDAPRAAVSFTMKRSIGSYRASETIGTRMRISVAPAPKHSVPLTARKSSPVFAACPPALSVVKSTSDSMPSVAALPKRFTTMTAQPWPSTAKLVRLAMRRMGSSTAALFASWATSSAGATPVGAASAGGMSASAISVTTTALCSSSRPSRPSAASSCPVSVASAIGLPRAALEMSWNMIPVLNA